MGFVQQGLFYFLTDKSLALRADCAKRGSHFTTLWDVCYIFVCIYFLLRFGSRWPFAVYKNRKRIKPLSLIFSCMNQDIGGGVNRQLFYSQSPIDMYELPTRSSRRTGRATVSGMPTCRARFAPFCCPKARISLQPPWKKSMGQYFRAVVGKRKVVRQHEAMGLVGFASGRRVAATAVYCNLTDHSSSEFCQWYSPPLYEGAGMRGDITGIIRHIRSVISSAFPPQCLHMVVNARAGEGGSGQLTVKCSWRFV